MTFVAIEVRPACGTYGLHLTAKVDKPAGHRIIGGGASGAQACLAVACLFETGTEFRRNSST